MLSLLFTILAIVVQIFLVLLFVRFVLDWVQVLARDWRPKGVALVLAEATYTVTDPPIRAVRKVIPPLSLGGIRLDLAFLVVFFLTWFLLSVLSALAAANA